MPPPHSLTFSFDTLEMSKLI